MGILIMIVDDDPDDIDIFIDAAREVEPTVVCASAQNGFDALNLIRAKNIKPDFIFVDLNMPKMNGKQFIEEIRKNPDFNDTQLIVYSTSKIDDDEKEVISLGANGFITKPTSLDELCNNIARIISKGYHTSASPPDATNYQLYKK